MSRTAGLTAIPDPELARLFRLSVRGELPDPIERKALLLRGFNQLADHAEVLHGLSAPAVQAVLKAVIAERKAVAQKLKLLEQLKRQVSGGE
ncbi:MAG: hypothetical protein KC613_00990 [Myxococcales bacterium]|nr:hypothetical protein [Myxococcales bacterium]MCB9526463.1 hypothetical protein [Myxococcales bacterium]